MLISVAVPPRNIKKVVTSVAIILLCGCGVSRYHQSQSCKRRGEALRSRIEGLKLQAHTKLTIGTKKEEVVRFFADNNIPVYFEKKPGLPKGMTSAEGRVYTTGCSPP